jgi:hypothetical protein
MSASTEYLDKYLLTEQTLDTATQRLTGWSEVVHESYFKNKWKGPPLGERNEKLFGMAYFRLAPDWLLMCKGWHGWELFKRWGGDILEIRGEQGQSGSGAYRTYSHGNAVSVQDLTAGRSWHNEFVETVNGKDASVDTDIVYRGPFSTGTNRGLDKIVEVLGRGHNIIWGAIRCWQDMYPGNIQLAIREGYWGVRPDDGGREHLELYVEGSYRGKPVGRVGWLKYQRIGERWVLQRISCYHRFVDLDGWLPDMQHEGLREWA